MALIMKKIVIVLMLCLAPIAFFNSCEKNLNNDIDCSSYDYSDCDTAEPVYGNVHIRLTINDENAKVPLTIYVGKLEENLVVVTDTASSASYDTILPINKFYTVKAEYHRGSKTIFAIDGDETTKSKTKTCDSTCWSVNQADVNVKLK